MTRNTKLVAGQKFNKLTVIKLYHTEDKVYNSKYEKNGKRTLHLEYYLCKCECGNKTVVEKSHLRKKINATESCGCIMGKHHMAHKNRLYRIWCGIRRRCLSSKPSNTDYKNYKGRGVCLCNEWRENFLNFYNWAINNGYNDNLTIDRIDNSGNYEPCNCRWVSQKEQNLNTRRNVFILYNGIKITIKELSDKLKMKYSTVYMRIKRNNLKSWEYK